MPQESSGTTAKVPLAIKLAVIAFCISLGVLTLFSALLIQNQPTVIEKFIVHQLTWFPLLAAILAAFTYFFSRVLTQQIRRQYKLLPLLGQGLYSRYREEIKLSRRNAWASELSQMESSLLDLSFQLENLSEKAKDSKQVVERLALFDPITGLANRKLMRYEVQSDLDRLNQTGDYPLVAVLLLDLDKFKRVNDSLGHPVGDRVLAKLADRFRAIMGGKGVIARISGDEFAILLRYPKSVNQLRRICETILQLVAKPLDMDGTTLVMNCSIGVSIAVRGDTAFDCLKHAEIAMYKAKERGRNTYCIFDDDMAKEARLEFSLEGDLRRAFLKEEFTLYLQPKVDMSARILGFESLVRWEHPQRGIITPAKFIKAMENMGLIAPLDRWMLETSCRQLKVLEQHYPDINIAVNISSTHFSDEAFYVFLKECLNNYSINPKNLELEITETLLMENLSEALEVIKRIKNLGVRIAIDDFGTGYSSLSYLKKLPVDTIKIDREFLQGIPDDDSNANIFSAIIYLAKQLNFTTVAEGVENELQLDFLRRHHCDLAQGYHFSVPVEAHKALLLLEKDRANYSGLSLVQ